MILASQSPRRQQLMAEAGLSFSVVPSPFDERGVTAVDPAALVALLAREKARAVAPQAAPDELVIGSDTVVVLGSAVLGKPADAQDARSMLRRLSGATHQVMTAVSIQRNGIEVRSFVEVADVTFWDLTEDEIDAYIASGEPFDKAGAYGIQGRGRLLVASINGDFYTVVGLPISRLVRELHALGAAA